MLWITERDNKILVCRLSVTQQKFANQKPTIPQNENCSCKLSDRRTSLVTNNKKKLLQSVLGSILYYITYVHKNDKIKNVCLAKSLNLKITEV
jgi:hypothetical protein